MPSTVFTRYLVALIVGIFTVQAVAVSWELYYYFWWLDIPMHIFGGLWIALFGLVSCAKFLRSETERFSALHIFAFAVSITMIIGLAWEIYEFAIDQTIGDSSLSLADTLTDLANDLVGALLAGWIFMRRGYTVRT